MAFHCACVTSYLPISKAFVIRTRCCGFSSFLPLLSSGEHPIMNSPAGIFTNSIPMAFFSAPVCAVEDTCPARQVTAIANVPRKTTLMRSPPQLCLGAFSKSAYESTELPLLPYCEFHRRDEFRHGCGPIPLLFIKEGNALASTAF